MTKNFILMFGFLLVLGANQASADSIVIVLGDGAVYRNYSRVSSSCDRTSSRYVGYYGNRYPTYVRQPGYYRTPSVSSYYPGCSTGYRANRYYSSSYGYRTVPYSSVRVLR